MSALPEVTKEAARTARVSLMKTAPTARARDPVKWAVGSNEEWG